MNRYGMGLTFRVIVIGVILLILAVVVLQGFTSGFGDFNLFTQDNIHSSDINTCESKVKGYCQQDDAGDWRQRYPECREHADAIQEGNDNVGSSGCS